MWPKALALAALYKARACVSRLFYGRLGVSSSPTEFNNRLSYDGIVQIRKCYLFWHRVNV